MESSQKTTSSVRTTGREKTFGERQADRESAAEVKRKKKDAAQAQVLADVKAAEIAAHCALEAAKQSETAVQLQGNSTEDQVKSQNKQLSRGRPSEYTDEEADRICVWIAEGRSLRSYCRLEHRGMDSVYRWLRERKDFRERYARAHDDRADSLADEIVDIADEAAAGTSEEIQAARLRVDARKWVAAKLKPSKWGEYTPDQVKSNITFNIGIRQQHGAQPTIIDNPLPVLGSSPDK